MNHRRRVKQMTLDGQLLIIHRSMTKASDKTKIDISHISRCCLKFNKSAGGFRWEFDETQFHKEDPLDKLLLLDEDFSSPKLTKSNH